MKRIFSLLSCSRPSGQRCRSIKDGAVGLGVPAASPGLPDSLAAGPRQGPSELSSSPASAQSGEYKSHQPQLSAKRKLLHRMDLFDLFFGIDRRRKRNQTAIRQAIVSGRNTFQSRIFATVSAKS